MSLKMLLRLCTCSFQRREGDRPSEAVPKFLWQFLARVGVDILCSPPPKSELCAALQPNFAQPTEIALAVAPEDLLLRGHCRGHSPKLPISAAAAQNISPSRLSY